MVNIPPEVKHWHGAAPDSWFSRLAVEVPAEDSSIDVTASPGAGFLAAANDLDNFGTGHPVTWIHYGRNTPERKDFMICIICLGIIGSIFLGDLWIKNRIEKRNTGEGMNRILGGRLLIRKYHNTGAAFNLGGRKPLAVTAVSLVLTTGISVLFLLSLGQYGNHLLRVGLSLLLGGAFSNTYDRLKRRYVVDYVSFPVKWKPLARLVFNISDFCIIIGALCILLSSIDHNL